MEAALSIFSASAAGKGAYAARIALDSIEIRNKHRTDRIRPTSVSLHTDSAATRAEAASGDLSLTFSTPQSADSLIAALTRSARTLAGQIDAQSIDMEQLKPALPDFALRVSAGPDNILNSLLKSRKIAFDALNASRLGGSTRFRRLPGRRRGRRIGCDVHDGRGRRQRRGTQQDQAARRRADSLR